MKQLGLTEKSEIETMGVDSFNAKARESVLAYTREWEDYVTRQARWVDFERGYKTLDTVVHGVACCGRSRPSTTRVSRTRATACCPYCWRDETPLSTPRAAHGRRRLQDAPGPVGHGDLPARRARRPRHSDSPPCARSRGRPRPGRCPTNLALAVGPDIRYVVVPGGPLGAADVHHGPTGAATSPPRPSRTATCSPRSCCRTTRRISATSRRMPRAPPSMQRVLGADLAGRHLRPALRLLRGCRDLGHRSARGGSSSTTTSRPATAPASSTRRPAYGEDDQRVTEAAGIPLIMSLDDGGRFLPAGDGCRGRAVDGRQHAARAHPPPGRAPAAPRELRALVPALLALPQSADLQGGLELVRARHRDQGSADREQRADHVGARERQARASSASGSRARATGRSAATATGARRSRCGRATTPSTRASTCTDRSRTSSATSAACRATPRARSTCTVRTSTTSPARTPTTRPAGARCAASRTSSTCGSTPASMPYAQVHYPFENHEWFDEHSPADFIVEYIGQTRGWFYVMHVLSTALFDRPAFTGVSCHGIVLGSDGLKMSKSLRNYPDVSRGLRPRRLRRDALVPDGRARCCAAATSS